MGIVVIGVNHQTAPVSVRARLALPPQELAEPLARFDNPAIAELVILSTCNRVEFYVQTPAPEAGVAACQAFMAAYHRLAVREFAPYLYQWQDLEAVQHLFRVAAGLDSMVLGEPQILGQVKTAYLTAHAADRTGEVLQQLFERAFKVAKRVRTDTGIGEHAVSVSYAAVELAKKIFEHLTQCTAMVLGAGDTSELAARHLVRQGIGRLYVANRTPERAAKLAQALHAEALPWEAFPEQLAQTDIVLSSTSAPHPIIDRAMVQAAMRVRHGRPMFCIDMAVPRDVAPEISDLDNVFLYNIDDLEHVVAANRGERQRAALAAERLIQGEARQFQQWLAARAATPMIVALRQQAEDIRRSELAKALSRLQALGVQERQTIEALTVAIVNKLLHAPTVNLKRAFQEGREDYRQLIDSLFGLDHGGGVVLDADAAGANGAA